MEEPPKKFFRLAPGREVRLRYAYFIKCERVIKDETGRVVELRCTYDPATRGGAAPDGRKVKATIHWVSARLGVPAEVRLYDRLFKVEDPAGAEKAGTPFSELLNENSLQVLQGCVVEPDCKKPRQAAITSSNDLAISPRTMEIQNPTPWFSTAP